MEETPEDAELLQRLREEAQAKHSYSWNCSSPDCALSAFLAGNAADRIDAQAAEITALRAEQVRLERDLDAYLAAHDRRMAELNVMQDEMRALRAERDAMRAAIFGGTNYASDLQLGNFLEMIRATEAGRLGGIARAEKAEAERDALAARLAVPGEEADLIEPLARIIAPTSWSMFDDTMRPFQEIRGATGHDNAWYYALCWKAGCRTPEQARRHLLIGEIEAKDVTSQLVELRESIVTAERVVAFLALTALRARAAGLEGEIADLKVSVIAFGAPAMVEYAKGLGLPDGHLHPHHYDTLKAAGARMDSFTRAALSPSAQEARDAE